MENGVWLATMNSEHYTWTAIGKTEEEAVKTIALEWNFGNGSENREFMSLYELEEYYGINCRFIEFGKCEWN